MIHDERENIRQHLSGALAAAHHYATTKIKQSKALGYHTKSLEAIATKINAALHHADQPLAELVIHADKPFPRYSLASKYVR